MPTTALITGITGQDGSYLAELLLSKGYAVHGVMRRTTRAQKWFLSIENKLQLHTFDLRSSGSIRDLISAVQFDEIYHLASPSFVPQSWDDPLQNLFVTAAAMTEILDAVRKSRPAARVYFAGSSEMFGKVAESPQTETTDFRPCNPYAAAKVFAHHTMKSFREQYGTFACTGILYNHESPRRSPKFVTRKITRTAAAIKLGLATELQLGNLSASRDWGFAGDYVESMWKMLQRDEPSDFVIGTGKTTTVREFAQNAFALLGLDYQDYIKIDSELCRPLNETPLIADPSLAMADLPWRAETTLPELIRMMVDHDLKELETNGGDQLGAA